ncbi:MAG: hypothetical protein JJE04_11580 [Acidobacteriia bacterium]|nr:hypothetical protein [Terriglobia bacterium]
MARKKKIEIELDKVPKRNPYVVAARKRQAGPMKVRVKTKVRSKPRLEELSGEE